MNTQKNHENKATENIPSFLSENNVTKKQASKKVREGDTDNAVLRKEGFGCSTGRCSHILGPASQKKFARFKPYSERHKYKDRAAPFFNQWGNTGEPKHSKEV